MKNDEVAIGPLRYLTANVYRSQLLIHILEYKEEDGLVIPTRKIICFSPKRWGLYRGYLDDVSQQVESMKLNKPVNFSKHLGAKHFVVVRSEARCVNLRRFFLPANTTKKVPTRIGISLRLGEWNVLMDKIDLLYDKFPELRTVKLQRMLSQGTIWNRVRTLFKNLLTEKIKFLKRLSVLR